jgi:hypothetical protein
VIEVSEDSKDMVENKEVSEDSKDMVENKESGVFIDE